MPSRWTCTTNKLKEPNQVHRSKTLLLNISLISNQPLVASNIPNKWYKHISSMLHVRVSYRVVVQHQWEEMRIAKDRALTKWCIHSSTPCNHLHRCKRIHLVAFSHHILQQANNNRRWTNHQHNSQSLISSKTKRMANLRLLHSSNPRSPWYVASTSRCSCSPASTSLSRAVQDNPVTTPTHLAPWLVAVERTRTKVEMQVPTPTSS